MKNKGNVFAYLVIALVLTIAILTNACTSPSKEAVTDKTKAVVEECIFLIRSDFPNNYKLKVKYLEYGVVGHQYSPERYEVGDTIYVRDIYDTVQ
jgi:hypothetical protein